MFGKQVFVEGLCKNIGDVFGTRYFNNMEGEGGDLLDYEISYFVQMAGSWASLDRFNQGEEGCVVFVGWGGLGLGVAKFMEEESKPDDVLSELLQYTRFSFGR